MLAKLAKIGRDQSGNALIFACLSMPVVIGAGGLATDTVQWTLWKRQIQREADSAALAGAYAKALGDSPSAAATKEIVRHNLVTLLGAPTIENAPTTGAYAGNDKAVRVVLSTRRTLPFSSFFLSSAPIVRAEATAAAVQSGNYCIIALEHTGMAGVNMQGNASVDMGCGIATNSRGASAVIASGSSQIVATPVAAVGGLQWSSNYVSPTTLIPYTTPQADPFAGLADPVVPNSCANKLTVQPNDPTTTIGPGCYRGMDLKGKVNLQPGTYIIDGGSFNVGSQAKVVGDGVTIILTSKTASTSPATIATVDMNGGADVRITAPASGTYAGIMFYQDRRALDSGTNKFNGNSTSIYQGAIYMAKQAVEFSGNSGMTTDCFQIVSRRVTFIGNSHITNVCPTGGGSNSFVGTRVQLVS